MLLFVDHGVMRMKHKQHIGWGVDHDLLEDPGWAHETQILTDPEQREPR